MAAGPANRLRTPCIEQGDPTAPTVLFVHAVHDSARVMRGRMDWDRLVFESVREPPRPSPPDVGASDPNELTWRNEMSVGGAPWSLVEDYRMTPV